MLNPYVSCVDPFLLMVRSQVYPSFMFHNPKKSVKTRLNPHLAGGLEHVYFPFHIWDVILPIDFHIFQDG